MHVSGYDPILGITGQGVGLCCVRLNNIIVTMLMWELGYVCVKPNGPTGREGKASLFQVCRCRKVTESAAPSARQGICAPQPGLYRPASESKKEGIEGPRWRF